MANIELKIKADFEQAANDLKNFGAVSEQEAVRVRRFVESFKPDQIEKFIASQDRNRIAMTATRGSLEATQIETKNLQKEIERLISKGIEPNSEAIKPLINEYARLQTEIEQTRQKDEALRKESERLNTAVKELGSKSVNIAKNALLGLSGAVIAATVAVGKSTLDLIEAGDTYSENAAKIGLSVEALQQFEYAAKMQDVSAESLTNGMLKLNASVGELKEGTGSLYTTLKKSNTELLAQLQNAQNNEEAFNAVLTALDATTNEFDRAALAQDIFGKSGKDLLLLTDGGIEKFNALKQEVLDYGIITTETAARAGEFDEAQKRLNAAFSGAKNELLSGLIPSFTDFINKTTEFISNGDNLENTLKAVGLVAAGAASGLVAFLIAAKGKDIVEGMTTAFKALNVALAANPVGAIATVIAAIAVPAFIALADKTGMFLSTAESLKRTEKELKENTEGLRTATINYTSASVELATKTNSLNKEEKITLESRKELAKLDIAASLTKTISALDKTNTAYIKQGESIESIQYNIDRYNDQLVYLNEKLKEQQTEAARLKSIGFKEPYINSRTSVAAFAMEIERTNKSLISNLDALAKNKSELQNANDVRKNTMIMLAEAVNLGTLEISQIEIRNSVLAKEVLLLSQKLKLEASIAKTATEPKQPTANVPTISPAELEKANERVLELAKKYQQQLEDMNPNKRALIQLDYERAQAEIKASNASDSSQQQALKSLKVLYAEKFRLYDEDEAKAGSVLSKRLEKLNNDEAILQNENIEQFKSFLVARIEQERKSGNERLSFLNSEYKRIASLENISAEEKASALKAVKDLSIEYFNEEVEEKKKLRDKQSDAEKKAADEREKAEKETLDKIVSKIKSVTQTIGDVISAGVSLFSAFSDRALSDAEKKYSALTQAELDYQAFMDDQGERALEKQYARLALLTSANYDSKAGMTQAELDYQAFLDAEKSAEVEKDKAKLEELNTQLAAAKTEQERISIQADINELQSTLTKNELSANATASRFEKERQEEIDALNLSIKNERLRAEAEAARAEQEAKLAKEQRKIARDNAIVQKIASSFSIVAKTAEAVATSIAASPLTFGVPWSIINAGLGAAQLAAVIAAPLPSAQTGTGSLGFTVPDNGTFRADSTPLMVSPGETVHVAPRGTSMQQNISIEIDKKVLIAVINEGIQDGDVRITFDNIRGRMTA